jgi:hypothetical protein
MSVVRVGSRFCETASHMISRDFGSAPWVKIHHPVVFDQVTTHRVFAIVPGMNGQDGLIA